MLVRYFMSTKVLTLSPEQKCLEALQYLKKHRIRRAPVLDKNKLVGIVSERDLYRVIPKTFLQTSREDNEAGADIPVKNIMATDIQVLSPNDHLETAARMMLKNKIGGIPVLKDKHLEGLITESDIFKAMWSILSHKTSHRIMFYEKGSDKNKVTNDYIELCFKHDCMVNTFVSYPKPDGGYIHYLCIQGTGVDNLIKDLWSHSCEVIIVERYTPESGS